VSLTKGDYISILTGGLWEDVTASPPTTPTLSVTNDGDGDAVTATVSGDDGVTNQLYYKKTTASAWTEGESRAGDGEIAQAGLDEDAGYDFIVVSQSGGYNSLPSNNVRLVVRSTDETPADAATSGVFDAMMRDIVASTDLAEWIVYTKASGATRRIRAAVNRQPAAPLDEAPEGMRPFMLVTVEASAVSGISLDELETSTDTLTFPKRYGGTPEAFSVDKIASHARGRLQLEIR